MNLSARIERLEDRTGVGKCPECKDGMCIVDDTVPGKDPVFPTHCRACGKLLLGRTKYVSKSMWDELGIGP